MQSFVPGTIKIAQTCIKFNGQVYNNKYQPKCLQIVIFFYINILSKRSYSKNDIFTCVDFLWQTLHLDNSLIIKCCSFQNKFRSGYFHSNRIQIKSVLTKESLHLTSTCSHACQIFLNLDLNVL